MTALKMVVRQNRAADNGQVGIGADKIMRELADEIEQLAEAGTVDLHRGVHGI